MTRLPGNVDHCVPVLGSSGCQCVVAIAVSTHRYRTNGHINPASEACHLMPRGDGGRGDGMPDPGRSSKDEKLHGRNDGSALISTRLISVRADR